MTGERLRSFLWGRDDGRVRAVWRISVPVVTAFLALQLASGVSLAAGASRGETMLVAFAATTVVVAAVAGLTARFLDRRPLHAYGYRLSREWWSTVAVGTALGVGVVAVAVVFGWAAGSLRVTEVTLVPGPALLGRLAVFFLAFVGVAFYEEFVYRGSFLTNGVEGLVARGLDRHTARIVALVASTLAFALVHLPGAILGSLGATDVALVFLKTGALGGLFGVAYLRTGELALPTGLHLGVNYGLMNVFGVGAATVAGVPSLVAVDVVATGLWSPVRGLPTLAAVLVGYLSVGLWTRRRRSRTDGRDTHQTQYEPDRS